MFLGLKVKGQDLIPALLAKQASHYKTSPQSRISAAPGMSSAVSTADTGLEEALGSLQFVSPDIASLCTCTHTKSSIVRLHLSRFAYFEQRCQAYGKHFHTVHANTRDSARFEHTQGSNEWNADFAYLYYISKMVAQAPPDVT